MLEMLAAGSATPQVAPPAPILTEQHSGMRDDAHGWALGGRLLEPRDTSVAVAATADSGRWAVGPGGRITRIALQRR